MLKAILFDVDGTLADTERDGHRPAFNQAFKDAGLDWHWGEDTYGELLSVTGGKERIRYFIDKYHPKVPQVANQSAWIADLHRSKTAHYLQLLKQGKIPLRPGVSRLINQARDQNIRLAIATTTTPENVTELLKATLGEDSINWFEVIAAGDIVPAKKPAPDIYTFTLKEMNLEPNECIALEDSHNGVVSARHADLTVIVTANPYTAGDDFSGASAVLSDLGEPNRPCRRISGCEPTKGYVDTAFLSYCLPR